jgi:hypothetical protein
LETFPIDFERPPERPLTFVLLCLCAVYRHGASWYLGGVSAMALLVALGNYLRTYLTVLAGVRASKQLHLDVRHPQHPTP